MTLDHLNNITIIGQGNPTVNCNGTGALKFVTCKNVTIEGINWQKCGTSNISSTNSGIEFHNSSNILIISCLLYKFTGQAILLSNVSGNVLIHNCTFMYNSQYGGHGTAVFCLPWKQDEVINKLKIEASNFIMNGLAQSVVYIGDCVNRCFVDVFLQDSVFINNQGVPIYISHNTLHLSGLHLHICGSVLFKGNMANAGGGIYSINSTVSFCEGATVQFIRNIVETNGGAICLSNSVVHFSSSSFVNFYYNHARENGGAIHSDISIITFDDNSIVKFNSNDVYDNNGNIVHDNNVGGAVYCEDSSHITFDGNSSVTFNNNFANDGGALHCEDSSHITFDGNSSVTFNWNLALDNAGAIYCKDSSHITFDGNSSVKFYRNLALDNAGAIYCEDSSHITFDGNSSVKFYRNAAFDNGAAVYCEDSDITFDGNSSVTFDFNKAFQNGGALYCQYSEITFDGNSSVTFNVNEAFHDGGAVYCQDSEITFEGNSSVTFNVNEALHDGGAVYCQESEITFDGNSNVMFNDNEANLNGGAVYSIYISYIAFYGNSSVTFNNNTAMHSGGALYLQYQSTAVFKGNSTIVFEDNKVTIDGGVIYSSRQSNISLDENTSIEFKHNTAETGGACSIVQSNMLCTGNSSVVITKNFADLGGAFYGSHSSMLFTDNTTVKFTDNIADNGGAVYTVQSSLKFTGNSSIILTNNTAIENGGAIHISDNFTAIFQENSQVTMFLNSADRYGGVIYAELTQSFQSKIIFKTAGIKFYDNTALRGPNIYVDIPTSCNDTCLQNSIVITNSSSFINSSLRRYINTPPKKLEFYNTATCIENGTNKNCLTYLTRNIMLGQEIIIDACVLDYYDQPVDGTLFIINGEDESHQINGSSYVLVSCENFQGVRIVGMKVFKADNYSINITSHDGSKSDLKTLSLKLITELSPCHPGFHYANDTCVCYSGSDNIVSCFGSTSSIKRGYWFGEVDGMATVTVCPNNYCNFTCCETANGYYKLSTMRTDQCNLQRSGTACGSCEDGYTLSFDSVECVSVRQCTPGQTALIVILSIIYWIAIVVLVFIMTYYHVGIGYLYAITYYYSVVDILLSDILYTTQGLFTTVSIMSSIAKVTPQFLGQLCLVQNMSGIDQQFIHYVHPLAVTIILSVICLSARISYRISAFVSHGILHVVCFLLLLSYTSVATTSLLLLRSLAFHNVDKVYTYLSPDIEYFHGRHLPYVIAAILCTLVIVVGLPLLLLLEPFLNQRINFTRIKPLLDQFQGCYKDKYRSFAAYYMSCRLVIILIVIVSSSNDNTTQYRLITVNAIFSLLQVTIRPYESNLLNMFDGMILQLMIVVSMLPLVDKYDQDMLLSFTFILVLLPLLTFLMMEIYLYKRAIKHLARTFMSWLLPKPDTTNDNNEIPMRDIVDSVIDDSCRENAYICEM